MGALAALHHVEETGTGQVGDAAIYESVLAVTKSLLPEYVFAGRIRERTGPFLLNGAPSNPYPTLNDDWLVIAANQDSLSGHLCAPIGQPELAQHAPAPL